MRRAFILFLFFLFFHHAAFPLHSLPFNYQLPAGTKSILPGFHHVSAGFCFTNDSQVFRPDRIYPLTFGCAAVYGATLYGLNKLWYSDYPRSSFHFFNDNREWLQIDKTGHFYTAYYESVIGIELMKWSGIKDKRAIVFGGLWGIFLQTPIEILDGYSANWGFSAGDFSANVLGSALAIGQEIAFNEQKIIFHFSYFPTDYASKRPDILGNSFITSLLKDYNGQTYWFSTSFNNLSGNKKIFPDWLCLSVGYGAGGMLGGENNPADFAKIKRYRQFYLSFDIDTLKLRGKNKFLNVLLTAASVFKFPAPALEFNNNDNHNFRFHLISF